MPKAFEVKNGIATAAAKQLWSMAKPKPNASYPGYGIPAIYYPGKPEQCFDVRWSGKSAFAAWEVMNNPQTGEELGVTATINYPWIDDRAFLTRAEADLFAGYTLHEIGHVCYTDNQATHGLHGNVFEIWNGLEDPRIETCVIRAGVGGARRAFEQLLSKLLIDCKGKWNPCDHRNIAFSLAVLGRMRLYGADIPMLRNVWKRMPPKIAAFYGWAMDELAKAPLGREGTKHCVLLAKEICRRLNKFDDAEVLEEPGNAPAEESEQQEQSEQQPGQSGDEGEEDQELGDDDEQSEQSEEQLSSGEGDDYDPSIDEDADPDDELDFDADDDGFDGFEADEQEGEGSSGEGEESSEEDSEEGEGAAGGEAGGSEADGESDEGEASGEESTDQFNNPGNFGKGGDMNTPEFDIEEVAKKVAKRSKKELPDASTKGVIPGRASEDDLRDFLRMGRAGFRSDYQPEPSAIHNATLRQAILRLLDAPEMCGWDNQRSSGKFDRRAVTKMMAGSENVFQRRWESEGIDTAVTMLIDCSGSMSNGPIKACGDLARVMSGIFDKARIAFEVCGFTSGGRSGRFRLYGEHTMDGKTGRDASNGKYFVSESSSIGIFKGFNQTYGAARVGLNQIDNAASGCTPDLSAVSHCINKLMRRPEKRKLLFVLTDGIGDGAQTAIRVREAEAVGVDVIGVGIFTHVESIYPTSIYIDKLENLSGASFKEIIKTLGKRTAGRRVM